MERKRTIAVVAGMGIAASLLAGCSTSDQGDTEGAQSLRLFGNTTNATALNAIIAAFTEKNAGVTIATEFYGVSDGQAALTTQLNAGTAADVFQAYPGSGASNSVVQLAEGGWIADLSDREWASAVADNPSLTYEGKVVGAPQTAQGIGYIYSEEVMSEAGLTPPTTWSDVQPFCEAARANGTPAYGAAFQTGWPTIMIPYALTATLVYRENPEFSAEQYAGTASFADSAWVTAFEMFEDMNSWGCFQDAPNSTTYDQLVEQMSGGKVLGAVILPTIIPALNASAPEGTSWALAPFPATDDAEETYIPSANLVTFALNAESADNPLALKFIDFLASPEAVRIQVEIAGGIPAVPIEGFEAPNPALQTVMDFRADGRVFPFIDQQWRSPKIQQELIAGVQEMFAGTGTPVSTAARMDAALNG